MTKFGDKRNVPLSLDDLGLSGADASGDGENQGKATGLFWINAVKTVAWVVFAITFIIALILGLVESGHMTLIIMIGGFVTLAFLMMQADQAKNIYEMTKMMENVLEDKEKKDSLYKKDS